MEHALKDLFPKTLGNWVVSDLPLGETEWLKSVTKEMLRFDDYVYRAFRHGDLEFTIYVAYWRRNSMPAQLVAQHTPDACWPQQGWRCINSGGDTSIAGSLQPLNYRVFNQGENNNPVYVAFWHLADGKIQGSLEDEGHWQWWRDSLTRAAAGSPRQFFVRVSSNRPWTEILRQPEFRLVMDQLVELGRQP